MWKNNRPDGWKNPYLWSEAKIYEAGADAILKTIQDELKKCWNDTDKILFIQKLEGEE